MQKQIRKMPSSQKDFNNSFHTSVTALMKITTSLMRTSPSSTTTSSCYQELWRTSFHELWSWFTISSQRETRRGTDENLLQWLSWLDGGSSHRKGWLYQANRWILHRWQRHTSSTSLMDNLWSILGKDKRTWYRWDCWLDKSQNEDDTCVRFPCWTEICIRLPWYCWWVFSCYGFWVC